MHVKIKHPGVSYNEAYLVQARKAAATLSQLGQTVEEGDDDEYAAQEEAFEHQNHCYQQQEQNGGHPLPQPGQRNMEHASPPPTSSGMRFSSAALPAPPGTYIESPAVLAEMYQPPHPQQQFHRKPTGQDMRPAMPPPPQTSVNSDPPPSNFYHFSSAEARKAVPPKKRIFQDAMVNYSYPGGPGITQTVVEPSSNQDSNNGSFPVAKRFKPTVIPPTSSNGGSASSCAGAFFRFEASGAPASFHFVRNGKPAPTVVNPQQPLDTNPAVHSYHL